MEVMIDIETMSVATDASIMSIGAIRFDRRNPIQEIESMDKFYTRVDLKSCLQYGLHLDPVTQKWWKEQDKDVCKEIFDTENRLNIKDALTVFNNWFNKHEVRYVWAHGTHFDIPIMENAYKKVGIDIPWKFWYMRDTRTVYDFVKVYRDKNKMHHHAMYDAYTQVMAIQKAFKKINALIK